MKSYRKMVAMVTASAFSSMALLFPGSPFAIEKPGSVQSSLEGEEVGIQGYLIKDGVQTPIYQNSSVRKRRAVGKENVEKVPYPKLSSNPNDPIPNKGSVISETTNVGSILYFVDDHKSHLYIEKLANGHVELGYYDPETLAKEKIQAPGSVPPDIQRVYDEMYGDIWDGTLVKRETSYELLGSATMPVTDVYQFTQNIKTGLSKTNAFELATTMGWKISAKVGPENIIPGDLTAEYSQQLSTRYNHSITVSEEKWTLQSMSTGKVNVPSYPYDYYQAAVYQLTSNYTVIPGPALKKVLRDNPKRIYLAKNSSQYADKSFYLARTPGSFQIAN